MKAVNLLPSDQRGSAKVASPAAAKAQAPSGDGFAAYAVLGALALAVVAVALMAMTNNTISDRKAELARTQAQVQVVAAQAAALKPYADFKQLAEARVQTVQALATTRFDWEKTLHDLSHALPRDVRLSAFKGSVAAGGGTPGAPAASPSIEISGCTSSQTSVAKLMARLRAVRGVTRVALRSSAKSESTTGGVDGGSLCKSSKGGTPSFSLAIFFERFGVPAYSSPASAAGAAPGGPTGSTAPAAPPAAAPPAAATPAPGTTSTTPAASSATTPTTEGAITP